MLFNTKFDIVIPLGADCSCTSHLKHFKLRHFSYPFDWLFKISFENRITLIKNHFQDFLVKKNLRFFDKNPNAIFQDNENDYYEDTKYGTQFLHDFIHDLEFNQSFQNVQEKYNRRIERFYTNIKQAENVLFVWYSKNTHLPNNIIFDAHKSIGKVFPQTQIYFLIIENCETTDQPTSQEFLNHNILKITAPIATMSTSDTQPIFMENKKTNASIFSQIKCKKAPFSFRTWLLKKYIRFFCMFIRPTKKRKLIRAYLNSQLLSIRD